MLSTQSSTNVPGCYSCDTKSFDHVHYSCNVYNDSTARFRANAQFLETRQSPIIDKAEEWNMAVSRFEIPTDLIPIFVFEPGAYKVTLTHVASGDNFQQTVVNSNTSPPTNEIFSVQGFLDDVNTAFRAAYTALIAAHPGSVDAPPVLIWSPSQKLFSLLGYQPHTRQVILHQSQPM